VTTENAPATERLVRAPEAARFLGYSTGHLRNMASLGAVPSVTLPTGGLRFRLSELAAWAEGQPKSEAGAA
jgi:predicted DNA-binding transcriptional regulator AlpA